MASLTQRTVILAGSQTLNYAVQFLSPIFLVRILDKTAFGQYKEFIVYSSLALTFISFGIKSNLLYFISKNIKNEKQYVTNTIFLLFSFSVIGIIIIYVFQGYIKSLTTFNFTSLLILYIFCFQNIDLLDNYWLAKKRSDYILYWSGFNVITRTGSLLLVAYLTKSVISIIYLLIILEIAKTSFTVFYLLKNKLFTGKINFILLKEQLNYILPLGFAALILQFNNNISNIIISSNLGAAALAIYAVGSQNIPLLNIIRQSVNNVIFPEMAQRTSKDPMDALNLWNRSNLLFLFLMAPLFVILFYYADLIIEILFTKNYSAAVPLFRIYLILLIRKCFEMGSPLRAMNKNKYFVFGNILSLIVNIVSLFVLYKILGFIGPAIAYVLTEISLAVFLAIKILSTYKIKISELFRWKKLLIVMSVSIIGFPIFYLGNFIKFNPIFNSIVFVTLYLIIYLLILRRIRIAELDFFMNKLLSRIKLKW